MITFTFRGDPFELGDPVSLIMAPDGEQFNGRINEVNFDLGYLTLTGAHGSLGFPLNDIVAMTHA